MAATSRRASSTSASERTLNARPTHGTRCPPARHRHHRRASRAQTGRARRCSCRTNGRPRHSRSRRVRGRATRRIHGHGRGRRRQGSRVRDGAAVSSCAGPVGRTSSQGTPRWARWHPDRACWRPQLAVVLLLMFSPSPRSHCPAIKRDSPGPALSSVSVGTAAPCVQRYKFRTMTVMEDSNSVRQAERTIPRASRSTKLKREPSSACQIRASPLPQIPGATESQSSALVEGFFSSLPGKPFLGAFSGAPVSMSCRNS